MQAFVVSEIDGILRTSVEDVQAVPQHPDDVLVEVEYSSVNYKDVMVASAPSRVRRVASLIGGVDAAGVVKESFDPTLLVGTRVVIHGSTFGVGRDGGFAPLLYAPARYITALPDELSTRDAMVIGTAGYTAMASVLALEHRGLAPKSSVLVTGATGGVGSFSVSLLTARGYCPVASTGSLDETDWLMAQGASSVIGRDDIGDKLDRVLGSERWDGAIDCVGGETLKQILRTLRYNASVAVSGLLGGGELNGTIYPFITRGVSLLGIDTVEATTATRIKVWNELGASIAQLPIESLTDRVISLTAIPQALSDVRSGATRGRIVVRPRND